MKLMIQQQLLHVRHTRLNSAFLSTVPVLIVRTWYAFSKI
jgi:hypothetical protein